MNRFSRYTLIGVVNTTVHWLVFAVLYGLGFTQALANGAGFLVAVSLSFLLNSKFTFEQKPKAKGYAWFVLGMGALSVGIGALGDALKLPALITLMAFSALSLVLGFAWSNWVVFRQST